MNKERRKSIDRVINEIEKLKELYASIVEEVEEIRDEESDYLDNIPENLQGSDRYYTAEEAVGNLDSAVDSLQEIDFDEIVDYLEEAKA